MSVGTVAGLARYPVKSMAGEPLQRAELVERGVVADRAWAAYTEDGRLGSGKSSRRFRKVAGLLSLRARCDDDLVPVLTLPDGTEHRAGSTDADTALSAHLGQPLRLRAEGELPHHDDSPVHVVTTASLRHLQEDIGAPVDARRFRANVLLEVDGSGFPEDGWQGARLALGEEVVLRLGPGMPRCVMVGMAQPPEGLGVDGSLLRALGRLHGTELGLQASVERGGVVRVGDAATLLQP